MDNSNMIEVGVMGMNWWMNDVHAKILPERVMIMDLLELGNAGVEEVDEMAFNSFVEDCQLNKNKILV